MYQGCARMSEDVAGPRRRESVWRRLFIGQSIPTGRRVRPDVSSSIALSVLQSRMYDLSMSALLSSTRAHPASASLPPASAYIEPRRRYPERTYRGAQPPSRRWVVVCVPRLVGSIIFLRVACPINLTVSQESVKLSREPLPPGAGRDRSLSARLLSYTPVRPQTQSAS